MLSPHYLDNTVYKALAASRSQNHTTTSYIRTRRVVFALPFADEDEVLWQPSVEKLSHGPPDRHLLRLARVGLLVQSASL